MLGITKEKIHFKGGILAFVVHQRRAALCQSFAYDGCEQAALVCPQIAVGPEIALRFVVKLSKQQTTVGKIYLELVFALIAP